MNRAIVATALLLFFACKTPAPVIQSPATPTINTDASAAILDSLEAHSFSFQWLTAKAKIEVEEDGSKTEFTANFRIRNDSAIWVSVSPALGIEVARMLMTPDSIRVIDRMDKKHYVRGYDFFRSFTSLPVNYEAMQNLIEGNPVFLRESYDVIVHDSVISLVSRSDQGSDSLVISKNYLPLQQMIADSAAGTLRTANDHYDRQFPQPFSLSRKIVLKRPKLTSIEITFSKVKLNEPVKFPFKTDE